MKFKYFKSPGGEVYAFDIDDPTQLPYMEVAIVDKWEDVTDSWPPADWPPKENITNA